MVIFLEILMELFFVATLIPAAFALLAILDMTSGSLGGSRGSGRGCWRERLGGLAQT